MAYINHHHQPQRGIVSATRSTDRQWLVSLSEAKEHLRIGHTDDDDYITRLCQASQLVCENLTGVDFTGNSYIFYCDTWDQTKEVPNVSPIRSITQINYKDTNGVQTIWSNTNYYVAGGSQRSRIALTDGSSYPDLYDGIQNISIELTTQAFYTTTGMDMVAKQAVLITIADMYENRQSVIVGRIASKIPKTAQYLLDTMKIQTL